MYLCGDSFHLTALSLFLRLLVSLDDGQARCDKGLFSANCRLPFIFLRCDRGRLGSAWVVRLGSSVPQLGLIMVGRAGNEASNRPAISGVMRETKHGFLARMVAVDAGMQSEGSLCEGMGG